MKTHRSSMYLIPFTMAAAFLFVYGCASDGTKPTPGGTEQTSSACDLPKTQTGTPEELAWRIFVAANCRTEGGRLQWETWLSQACLDNPEDCTGKKRLRGSVSATLVADPAHSEPKEAPCSPMTTTQTADALLKPFVPTNLSANPVFCEEVVINKAEEAYTRQNGLLTVSGQESFLSKGNTVKTPPLSVEMKVDWVPASSFTGVTFDCSKPRSPSSTIYLQEFSGTCYALAGMHISSKLYPNWLWATFEPQDPRTNPNRCKPNLYNPCIDVFGSNPPRSTGENTNRTVDLKRLMNDAGAALDPSFQNYRLTGVQTEFADPVVTGGNLGSSFVEFNAQVDPHQASCITCHYYASRNPSTGKPGPGTPFTNATGTPKALPEGYDSLDFSWFLAFGVPQ